MKAENGNSNLTQSYGSNSTLTQLRLVDLVTRSLSYLYPYAIRVLHVCYPYVPVWCFIQVH